MHLAELPSILPAPAHELTRDLPRDQALGLRLMALARAAAAVHMAQSVHPPRTIGMSTCADGAEAAQMLRTQAAGLLSASGQGCGGAQP